MTDPKYVLDSEEGYQELQKRIPEPAVIRGAVVAVVGLVGGVLGTTYDVSWLEPALATYAVVAPALLSWWIRMHVSPAKKTT